MARFIGKGSAHPRAALDATRILVGSLLFGVGLDAFEIPYGISAGGLSGIALVTHTVAERMGFSLPIGVQVVGRFGGDGTTLAVAGMIEKGLRG